MKKCRFIGAKWNALNITSSCDLSTNAHYIT
uniref:Uncharacterized protein n=1 Tax=Arundo donax TaxID=35708 RepID=A0A0A9A8C3_ARUDO